mmetsp:Transcript_60459/g.141592  ORF Transcript_60459/g.141592 Transcript_60459/m.141592 type:complete len:678 (+) Transcript_60459:42-2075(+)
MAAMIQSFWAILGLLVSPANACTIIAVGRSASASGAPMIGHSDDAGSSTNDIRLIRVPRQRWPEGSKRPVYFWQIGYPRLVSSERSPEYAAVGDQKDTHPLGFVPQVPETWAYWDTDYGVQNEWGLSIGESTSSARTVGWPVSKPQGNCLFGIEELTKIALERCKTSRCAVETMGYMAETYGFYSDDVGDPSNPDYSDGSESLVLADAEPGDLWIFNVMTGRSNSSAIWAAQRIPPDHVAAVANTFTIRHLNLSDPDNNLYSHGVTQLAEEKGWWVPPPDKPEIFDFFGSYGYQVNFTDRRMWRIFNLLSPEEGAKLNPATNVCDPFAKDVFPASVPAPQGSVTLDKVMNVFRDHYEGTPFDLTKGMAAGPWSSPNRGGVAPIGVNQGQFERAISMFRTSWSFVCVAKRSRQASMWFGYDAPHGTVYLPFYGAAVEGAPDSYHSSEGHMSKFSTKVAWWAFNLINQYTDLNFALINKEVRQKAKAVEKIALQQSYTWEDDAAKMASSSRDGPAAATQHLTKKSNEFASEVVAQWWDFAWMLIAKYGRYSVTFNESETGALGQVYPAWWLRNPEVGYTAFTPKGPNTGRNVTDEMLAELDEVPKLKLQLVSLQQELEAEKAKARSSEIFRAFQLGPSIGVEMAMFLIVLMSTAFGLYRAGVRHGKSRDFDDDCYFAQP